MADILFPYSFKTSIRLSGVSGLSLFDLCLLNEIFLTSYQVITFFSIIHFGKLFKTYRTVFCGLFAFKLKLKHGTAIKVSSRRFCRVNVNVFTEWWRELAATMNILESDKRYGCFNGNQFRESVVVISSHRNEKKFMPIINLRTLNWGFVRFY